MLSGLWFSDIYFRFYVATNNILASQKCYINASGHGMHCRPYGVRPWQPCCLCIQLLVDYWQQKYHRQNYEPCFAPKSDAGFSRLRPLEIELTLASMANQNQATQQTTAHNDRRPEGNGFLGFAGKRLNTKYSYLHI